MPSFRFSFPPLQQVILGVIGIPAALIAGWAVEVPYIGRKGTLAISSGEYPTVKHTALFNSFPQNAGLTGTFLFASTTSRSSNELLGWNCGYALCSNVSGSLVDRHRKSVEVDVLQIMYGVLYAMSSEIFPAIHRGTGNCLTSTAKGVFGVMVSSLTLPPSRSTHAHLDVNFDDGHNDRHRLLHCMLICRRPHPCISQGAC